MPAALAVGAGDFLVPTVDDSEQKYVDAAELRGKINQVLSDPTFTKNAQRISEKLKTYGGASAVAQLIEDFSKGSLP